MHEMSIVEAVIERVRAAVVPTVPGASERSPGKSSPAPGLPKIRAVRLRAGPLRGLDPEVMLWSWGAATEGTDLREAALCLDVLPWSARCPACGRQWTSPQVPQACICGSVEPEVTGSDELILVSLQVDDPVPVPP